MSETAVDEMDADERKDENEAPAYCCDSQDCEDCEGCAFFLLPLLVVYFIFLFFQETVTVGEHRLWRIPSDYRPTEDDRDASILYYLLFAILMVGALIVDHGSDIGVGKATRAEIMPYLWAAVGVCFVLPLPRALVVLVASPAAASGAASTYASSAPTPSPPLDGRGSLGPGFHLSAHRLPSRGNTANRSHGEADRAVRSTGDKAATTRAKCGRLSSPSKKAA